MNNNITGLFVTYEIALKLKEKGFDQPCFGSYYDEGKFSFWNWTVYTDYPYLTKNSVLINMIAAPLWQQVIDWLSDVHNIEVDALRYTYHGGVYQGKCYMWFVDQYDPKYNHELEEDNSHWILNERKAQGYDFKTKREAILAGIIEALTLI